MFNTRIVILLLVGAAVVGFLLDERRKRMTPDDQELTLIQFSDLPRRRGAV